MADETSAPVWFGAGHEPDLFGWLHYPATERARGGVVLCPPLGVERISAHDTYRLLAETLVERGLATLRFDYLGTGDSAGTLETVGGVEIWLDNIRGAVEFIRAAGMRHIAVVGMRMGATLAACDAGRLGPLDAMVLWDPCVSGKSFLRQQRALRQMMFGSDAEGSLVETPGFVYPESLFHELAEIDLHNASPRLAARTLLLLRKEAIIRSSGLPFDGAGFECEEVLGQPDLLDISTPESALPRQAIDRIGTWLAQISPSPDEALELPLSVRPETISERVAGFVERPVRLGPYALFGIVTEPDVVIAAPVIVFLNVAAEPHVGPARQWVELSRRLADSGLRSIRIDLSGLGDSPVRPNHVTRQMYTPEALDDVMDIARALSPDDPANIVLVGLCSGAYIALEVGRNLGVRGVVAINPVLDVSIPALTSAGGPAQTIVRPRSRFGSALLRHRRIKSVLLRLPMRFWWLAHVVKLQRSPADGLRDVVGRVGNTLIVCNEYDARAYRKRGGWIVEALERTGRLRFEVIDGIDHGLLTRRTRTRTADLVLAHLTANFGGRVLPLAAPDPSVRMG